MISLILLSKEEEVIGFKQRRVGHEVRSLWILEALGKYEKPINLRTLW